MTQIVQAIYEQGVFRPLEPITLPEHERVSLVVSDSVSTAGTNSAIDADRPTQSLGDALDRAAALPIEGPDDGFCGADHDLVLYGWKK